MSSLFPNPTAHARPISAQIQLRAMVAADFPAFESLCAQSFGPGRFARAAFRVREQLPLDLDFCFVAEMDGELIGGVQSTPISLSGKNGLLLGPLVTAPHARNLGAGRLLVKAVCDQIFDASSPMQNADRFVLLVGDQPYYGPLGFENVTVDQIHFPGAVDQSRILAKCMISKEIKSLTGNICAPV